MQLESAEISWGERRMSPLGGGVKPKSSSEGYGNSWTQHLRMQPVFEKCAAQHGTQRGKRFCPALLWSSSDRVNSPCLSSYGALWDWIPQAPYWLWVSQKLTKALSTSYTDTSWWCLWACLLFLHHSGPLPLEPKRMTAAERKSRTC